MTEVFTGLSHLNFEDLSIGIALYRPGSMDNIPEYQDRKNGLKPVTYPHSDLESILEETQGILVYQEQLMAVAQVLGGYSQGESDNLRKATGKKSEKVMNEVLPELEQRILDNGYDQEVATYAIEAIKPFVGYGLTTF